MSNYLRGVFPDEFCKFVEGHIALHIELNNAIRKYIISLMDGSSSSDDESSIPRPMFNRAYTGQQYVANLLSGHPLHSYDCFRLPSEAFHQLKELLVSRGLLQDTMYMLADEQLAIFLRGIAYAQTYRQLCEFFQHSLETVSRYFKIVLRAIVSLSDELIEFPTTEVECHPFLRSNTQFYPFFQNAIGAIDGIHIPAVVSKRLHNRYRNKKGSTSQNVMAAVSFDRQFVYVGSGWEGCATDMRVLQWAMEEGGFKVPVGKYFLVDYGYANTDKLIAPFRGYRYHFSDYHAETSCRYSIKQELYNHRHSQLRNVVKMTFGIWKERFKVLTHMPQFPLTIQADIVLACAVLHNFIGRYHGHDMYFNMLQTEMHHNSDHDLGDVQVNDEDLDMYGRIGERIQGDSLRHSIMTNLWEAHATSQRRRSI
ncbi:hypothetical protein MA16_Dca015245 [Dendrobium catenatum]|uniref:Uncharacterized protein n=1 Tax=Dendrobium catenatum TaxID=906689 RepID=A0A2I0VSF5_9ASPA|nr:hypothetical protein MA16_Dca015245 [Dendrobium catenatum]